MRGTKAGTLTLPPDVTETALAHADENEVRRAYNRSDYLEQRRPIIQWWADFMEVADNETIIQNDKKKYGWLGELKTALTC